MRIDTAKDGSVLRVEVIGRINTMTAPEFEDRVKSELEGVTELVIDFSRLIYISSAGLRVLLTLYKTMSGRGSMVVKGADKDVKKIFDMTGFSSILTLE